MTTKNKSKTKSRVAKNRLSTLPQAKWGLVAGCLLIIAIVLGFFVFRYSHAAGSYEYRRLSVYNTAMQQIGQREYSAQVLQYTENHQEAWCADFVSWVFKQSGYPFSVNSAAGRSSWRIPLAWHPVNNVPNMRDYFKSIGQWHDSTSVQPYAPAAGDVIVFGEEESHTGIVANYANKTVTTIEGNANDQVEQRSYTYTDSRILGYGTPLEAKIPSAAPTPAAKQ